MQANVSANQPCVKKIANMQEYHYIKEEGI
jgi:hypothetical protein